MATFAFSAAGGAGYGHSLDADDGDPTDAVYVDGDGNVGIGTTSPGAKLEVVGQVKITGEVLIMDSAATDHWGSSAPFFIDYTDTDYGNKNYLKIWGSPNTNEMRISNQPRGTPGGWLTLNQSGDLKVHGQALWSSKLRSHYNTSLILQATTDDSSEGIDFKNNLGTLLMHLGIGGNLGIGTTTPGEKLTVTGTVESTTGGFKFPDGTVQTSAGVGTDNDWTISGNDMYSSVSGNVGIGTSSPVLKLDVNGSMRWGGSSAPYAYTGVDGGGVYIEQVAPSDDSTLEKIRLQSAKGGGIAGINPNYTQFFVDPTNGFSFMSNGTANGNLGIGTTNPETKLQVSSGDVYVDNIGSGIILRSPDGSCFRVTINNDGTFASTSITCP